jgi:hypothetical protein
VVKIPRVQLPDGCYGLDMADGKKYTARPGDYVNVSDNHARQIKKSFYGGSGIMRGGEQFVIGTRAGRWCRSCAPARLWNSWNATCPRCGAETTEEDQP